jgi:protein O-mannosyl-transferase
MEKSSVSPIKILRSSWITGTGLLAVILFAAYFPVLQTGFVWDDDRNLTANPFFADFDSLVHIWLDVRSNPQYYPLLSTSFWIEHKLWGLNPLGYHINNVLLHGLNSIILWRILLFLGIPAAWMVSAVFALHPVHVESVAWITERKNVLSGVFYLLSLYTFLRFYFPGPTVFSNTRPIQNRSRFLYGISLFFFICALLSKTVTCTLPAVILLLFWWIENRIQLKIIWLTTPYFIFGLSFAYLTSWLEKVNTGAIGPEWDYSFWDRFIIAGRALWFYIGKLVWPFPIIFTYPRWNIDDSLWWQYLYPTSFLFFILILWALRNKVGRSPLTLILFFAGTIFPALGFFNIYFMRFSLVADHFQYLASISILLGIIVGMNRLTGKGWPVFALLLLFFLGQLTWKQIPVYKNHFTLWTDTVQKNPNAWMAHYNLANIFITKQKPEEAIAHYRETIRIKPDFPLAHFNLGNAMLAQKKIQEAILQFESTIRIKPDFVDAYNNLGVALLKEGSAEEAIKLFRQALDLKPDFADAQNNLKIARSISAGKQLKP